MKPKETFTVAIKIGGLWLLWSAVSCFTEAFLLGRGHSQRQDYTVTYWLIWGIFQSVISLYLLSSGKFLLNIAFPEDTEPEEEADSKTPQTNEKPVS